MFAATNGTDEIRRLLFQLAKHIDIAITCDDRLMSSLEAAFRSGDLDMMANAARYALHRAQAVT